MQFRFEQHLGAAPSDVLDMLLDPRFLAARSQLPKLGGAEVLQHTQDSTSARLRVRMRFVGELSSAVTAVVDPAKLTWVDDATFDFTTNTGDHSIVPDHYPDRLSAAYDDSVTAHESGSRRELRGALTVRVPLVGGRVERAIVGGLEEYAAAEADLLNRFLRGA